MKLCLPIIASLLMPLSSYAADITSTIPVSITCSGAVKSCATSHTIDFSTDYVEGAYGNEGYGIYKTETLKVSFEFIPKDVYVLGPGDAYYTELDYPAGVATFNIVFDAPSHTLAYQRGTVAGRQGGPFGQGVTFQSNVNVEGVGIFVASFSDVDLVRNFPVTNTDLSTQTGAISLSMRNTDLGGGSYALKDRQFLNFELTTNYEFVSAADPTAAVPEPETYAMLLAGLGLVGFATRRRNS